MSIVRGIDKEDVVHIYNGISLSHKKEQNNAICRTSLGAQLRLRTPSAGGSGSIPGRGTRSHMHATTNSWCAATKEPTCRN